MSIQQSIIELISFKIEQKGWKEDADDETHKFKLVIYPFSGLCKYKIRYIDITFIKHKYEKYQCILRVEHEGYCILTVEEEEEYYEGKEDHIYFSFTSELFDNLKDAILCSVNTLIELEKCASCNRIYNKRDLDKNDICLQCLLESLIQIKDECAICMDTEIPKIQYQFDCGHKYHFGCIIKLSKYQCPLCRRPFKLKH